MKSNKKMLKSKYNKLQKMNDGFGRNLNHKFGSTQIPDVRGNSVYGELKLSEQLANDLDMVKGHVDSLNE